MRIGIRREDKNKWERRVPLTPTNVSNLIGMGFDVSIQPSEIRIFSDEQYLKVGAVVEEDLGGCGLVLAVKEIPETLIRSGGAYMFFAHVCKGQPYNMRMLRRVLDSHATLIDYERITDNNERRLVFFGRHAGSAGMIETLHALGQRLEWEGVSTPFVSLKRPLDFRSLKEAKLQLLEIGDRIVQGELDERLAPLVIGFVGYGNVSRGAQELFDLLPHQEILPEDLKSFHLNSGFSSRKLYKVVFKEKDIVVPTSDGAQFDLSEYYEEPNRYQSIFGEYLKYFTVLVNCIYWDSRYPKLVTKELLREIWSGPNKPRLRVFGDITCDVNGSLECTVKATEPGAPTYTYIPSEGQAVDGWSGEGPVVMAVDTLPSEVPLESSSSFGDMLEPFLQEIESTDFESSFDELTLPGALKKAVIAHRGQLTPDYRYLSEFLSPTLGH